MRGLWGDVADDALQRADRVPALRALAGRTEPAAVLARLFVLGDGVAAADVAAALPTTGAAAAVEGGLLAAGDDGLLRGAIDLRPYSVVDALGVTAWWIASDLGELATGQALRTDHVLGIGGASATLSGLMLPDRARRVLDLGTGCGIQALHASRFADQVVATDISERALDFGRFNAALNGVDTIEFRLGSLYEPVAGERFDRIVSNPPFVITPRRGGVPEYEYRDGGMVGDALVAAVVAGAAEHLEPGGVAQLLGNWEYRDGVDGLNRAAAWAQDARLEFWMIERERIDPARYAETWIRDGGTKPGGPEWEPLVGAWLDDFAERGVDEIGFGYVLLRRPAEGAPTHQPLQRAERIPEALGENPAGLGPHLSAVLAAHDALAALGPDGVDDHAFRVAPDVTEQRSHWPGEESPSALVLRQGGGFGRSLQVSPAVSAAVGASDGELALGVLAGAIAQLLEQDERAVLIEIRAETIELIHCGLVVP
ncbi:methyltransferase [Schumannella sp. 10F1B-5-1]|nr:methyltransferase [Schumannella sp. 10F1B-5-1]